MSFFRQKYFFPEKAYFTAKNIPYSINAFLRQKYFLPPMINIQDFSDFFCFIFYFKNKFFF